MDLVTTFFTSLSGLAALNVIVADWINKTLKIEKGWAKQLISWIVPILVTTFGFVLQVGLFSTFGPLTAWTGWLYAVLTGLGTGLVSNGIYDINGVKTLLNSITSLFGRFLPKKDEE